MPNDYRKRKQTKAFIGGYVSNAKGKEIDELVRLDGTKYRKVWLEALIDRELKRRGRKIPNVSSE
jgi:hypothetical protein